MKLTYGIPKMIYADRLTKEYMKQKLEFEFKIYGHKDPTYDLKQHFIVDHKMDPFNSDFDQCWKRRERRQRLNFVNHEDFGETTREWKMNFDPIKTIRKMDRYNLPAPPSFEKRYIEMIQFDKLFTQRADFLDRNYVFGEPVEDQIDEYLYNQVKDEIVKKRLGKKLQDINDHHKLKKDIEQNPDIQLPVIPFEPLKNWT